VQSCGNDDFYSGAVFDILKKSLDNYKKCFINLYATENPVFDRMSMVDGQACR